MDENEIEITIQFQAVLFDTATPFRYVVELHVDGVRTGIAAFVWGRKRANHVMEAFVENGLGLLEKYGKVESVIQAVRSMRREKAMAQVKVGDSVRLLVDIGSIRKGRVCRVVEVVEPSFYDQRGANAWDDEKYPIRVIPVATAVDGVFLGPEDGVPLLRGEFGPLDQDVDE